MKWKSVLTLVGLTAFMSLKAYAHHSFGMFDLQKNIYYVGTIVEYNWENPHSHIIVKVDPGAKDSSTVGTWDVEANAVNIMARQGWTRNTFKPGDKVTIVAHPMRDGSKGASLFYAEFPDGKRLYADIARPSSAGGSRPGE